MTHFLLPDLIDIIVTYVSHDIFCYDIIRMGWPSPLLSKLQVSYLERIVDCFPNKINYSHLARNPALTPELIKKVECNECFKHYRLEDKLSIQESDTPGGDVHIDWENPKLPYEQIVKEDKYVIRWDLLGGNPSLPYQFLKEHKYQLGYLAISAHPNAGDLLFEMLDNPTNDSVTCAYRVFQNPSLNFERLNDLDKFIDNLENHPGTKIKNCANKIGLKYFLARNKNLPIEFIRKYYNGSNHIESKTKELIYIYNVNIRQIIKEFPLSQTNIGSMLQNPAYYTYCVEEETRKYLNSLTF